MNRPGGDLQQRLLTIFRVEADEHLSELARGLHDLESGGARDDTLERVFRAMHSLKGAARAVSLQEFERLAHGAENLLSALRRKRVPADNTVLAVLNAIVDSLQGQLVALAAGSAAPALPVSALLRRIDSVLAVAMPDPQRSSDPVDGALDPAPAEASETVPPALGEASALPGDLPYVRVAAGTLDALWAAAEAFVSARLLAAQRVQEIQQLCTSVALWRQQRRRFLPTPYTSSSKPGRAAFAAVAAPARLAGGHHEPTAEDELRARDLETRLGALYQSARSDQRALSGMIDVLHEGMKDSLMQPLSQLLDGLPGLLRALARSEGKQVRLLSAGGDLWVDRRVVDGLRTPLLHLLSNAVHHGIESAAVRAAAGKDETASVRVFASAGEAGTLELRVEDDGAGIAEAEVLVAAARTHQVMPAAADATARALAMIFESGVSTSDSVGRSSGRGLGLAIVREKIEQLGGSIRVHSQPGAGCRFHIRVPLTLANFRGVLVRVSGRTFVLPTAQVQRCVRVPGTRISEIEGRVTIEWMQRTVPLHSLAGLLKLPTPARPAHNAATSHLLVLVEAAALPMLAFEVDEVLGEQEVLLKLLSWPLQRLPHLMGATLLGDGQWVPVLHPADLVRAASAAQRTQPARVHPEGESGSVPTILVVEDSYTARAMLQAVLEAAGYRVLTAVDGLDALARLASAEIDVLVSDIEMPRLNGLDLSLQVRRTPGLEHLPIVLVTALESAEQRARGIEAGANAYLVKSSFDDRNLLDTVASLL